MAREDENNQQAHPAAACNAAQANTVRESDLQPGAAAAGDIATAQPQAGRIKEINGPKGPEPTRYGDWERNGRCIDF